MTSDGDVENLSDTGQALEVLRHPSPLREELAAEVLSNGNSEPYTGSANAAENGNGTEPGMYYPGSSDYGYHNFTGDYLVNSGWTSEDLYEDSGSGGRVPDPNGSDHPDSPIYTETDVDDELMEPDPDTSLTYLSSDSTKDIASALNEQAESLRQDSNSGLHIPAGASEELTAVIEATGQWISTSESLLGTKASNEIADFGVVLADVGLVDPEYVGESYALDVYHREISALEEIRADLLSREDDVDRVSEDLLSVVQRAIRRIDVIRDDLNEALRSYDQGMIGPGDTYFYELDSAGEAEVLGVLFEHVEQVEAEIEKVSDAVERSKNDVDEQAPDEGSNGGLDTTDDSDTATETYVQEAATAAEEAAVAAEQAAVSAEEAASAEDIAQDSEDDTSSDAEDASDTEDSGTDSDSSTSDSDDEETEDEETDEGEYDEEEAAASDDSSASSLLEMLPMLAMAAVAAVPSLVSALQPVISEVTNQSDAQKEDENGSPATGAPSPQAGAQPGGVESPAVPGPDGAASADPAAVPAPAGGTSGKAVEMQLPDGSTQKVSPTVAEAMNKELNNPNGSDAHAAYTGTPAGPWSAVDAANVRTGDVVQWAEVDDSSGQLGVTEQSNHTAMVVKSGDELQAIVNGRMVPLDTNHLPGDGMGGHEEFRGFYRPSDAGIELGGSSTTAGAAV